jgi:hypothetical protein
VSDDPILEALQARLNADRPGWYVHGFTVALGIMQINEDGSLTHDLTVYELEGQPPWTTSALLEWSKIQHDAQYECADTEGDD